MDIATIIADAMQVLNIGQLIIRMGQDATPFIQQAISVLQGNALTDSQRALMIQQETVLTAQLDAQSIPADQP